MKEIVRTVLFILSMFFFARAGYFAIKIIASLWGEYHGRKED
jgi:hypothetical protein|nr:MAG TPA: Sporulation protein YtrH [Caudoviricetes sp.]